MNKRLGIPEALVLGGRTFQFPWQFAAFEVDELATPCDAGPFMKMPGFLEHREPFRFRLIIVCRAK